MLDSLQPRNIIIRDQIQGHCTTREGNYRPIAYWTVHIREVDGSSPFTPTYLSTTGRRWWLCVWLTSVHLTQHPRMGLHAHVNPHGSKMWRHVDLVVSFMGFNHLW